LSDSEEGNVLAEHQGIRIKDLKQLKGVFWLLLCLCMLAIALYIPFLDNVNELIQVRFCFNQVAAGRNVMVTYLVTSLLGIPIGILVDRLGFKRYFIMIGMSVFLGAHLIIFVFPQCNPLDPSSSWSGASWGLIFLGLGYCFYANCILPSIPMVVSKKITGSAFGLMFMFENLAMAVCPMISGLIVENTADGAQGYRKVSLFFLILGVIGLCLSLLLFFINNNSKKLLDKNSKEKNVHAVQIDSISVDS
jgi:MFS family permease